MSDPNVESLIRGMVRTQYRAEGDLQAPKILDAQERQWWISEARKIEQEESQSSGAN